MEREQILTILFRVNLAVIAMEEYCIQPNAEEMDPQEQI